MDNYSVHSGRAVKDARQKLENAGVHLKYLPAYSPNLAAIEPIWNDLKYHQMTRRSFDDTLQLRQAVDFALQHKAKSLMSARLNSTMSTRAAA